MELNRLVQDKPPGQVTPGLAPPNLVEHLPNVPSYHPPITRIPVLIFRRTALSNSSFAKETRSSIRRLGSVKLTTQRAGVCGVLLHGLGSFLHGCHGLGVGPLFGLMEHHPFFLC